MTFRTPAETAEALLACTAVLFDLDGVLTPTAEVHMTAWRRTFAPLLTELGVAPYTEDDYFLHLDGKPRYDGVDDLLRSRGIVLPWGAPEDPPETATVCGVGNRKNATFARLLADEGVAPYPGSVALVAQLQQRGIPLAVVSSSKNAPEVLRAAGMSDIFPVVVDGNVAVREGLPGKPAPDTFLHAAALLGATATGSAVVEDAIGGVAAGAAGSFGLVIGVDRGAGPAALGDAGAHAVVTDLGELAAVIPPKGADRA